MDDVDRQADELLSYCQSQGITPTLENLSRAYREMTEISDLLIEFCREHGVPPTELNLRMAFGVLCALARNRMEENDAT